MDEPFTALDTPTCTRLILDLKEILSSIRVSTVFVTHNYPDTLVLSELVR